MSAEKRQNILSGSEQKKIMKIAIEEARNSLKEGNKGFGAVLIKNGKIIERAHDTEVTDSDPTAHAEMNLIRKASQKYDENLTECIVISTHEPCPMCTGAMIWAKVSEIVYGVPIADSMRLGRTMINLSCKEIIKRSPWKVRITEGVLKRECLKLSNDKVKKLLKEFLELQKNAEWKSIEEKLLKKRIKWFEDNKNEILKRLKGTNIEKAYQLILMKIGINKNEAPIIEESKKKIVFHSKNFCPALEACKILGLNTREICKEIFEKPTEELIKRINPKLRFTRNHKHIRPYTTYCEEIIEMET